MITGTVTKVETVKKMTSQIRIPKISEVAVPRKSELPVPRKSAQGEKGEKGEKERGEKGEKGESTKWHLLLLSPPPLLELPLGSVEEEKGGGGTIVSHTPVDPKGVGGSLCVSTL